MIRVASRTPSQLVPVHGLNHWPGLGGDADHAVLAHVVSGLSVAPWVGGLWIVTDLEVRLSLRNFYFMIESEPYTLKPAAR